MKCQDRLDTASTRRGEKVCWAEASGAQRDTRSAVEHDDTTAPSRQSIADTDNHNTAPAIRLRVMRYRIGS